MNDEGGLLKRSFKFCHNSPFIIHHCFKERDQLIYFTSPPQAFICPKDAIFMVVGFPGVRCIISNLKGSAHAPSPVTNENQHKPWGRRRRLKPVVE